MRTTLLSALFLLGLAACDFDDDIEGSGRIVDVQRSVAAFHAVAISDGLRAEIGVGPQDVLLHLDDNIVDHVHVEVRDGVLILEAKKNDTGFEPSSAAVIRVASPTIDFVSVHDGASAAAESQSKEVFAQSNDGAYLTMRAASASIVHAAARDGSRIVVTGRSDAMEIESHDGSQVDSLVPSESVSIRSHDGSEVRAHASRSAMVRASDGSNVRVRGNPAERDVSSSDGSSVEFGD